MRHFGFRVLLCRIIKYLSTRRQLSILQFCFDSLCIFDPTHGGEKPGTDDASQDLCFIDAGRGQEVRAIHTALPLSLEEP